MYLQLLRINEWWMNIAIAAVGFFISGNQNIEKFLLVIIATVCIWAFGFVINDIFDAEFDKKKKYNRNPISKGYVKKSHAVVISVLLAIVGVASSLLISPLSATFFLFLLILFYLYSTEPFRLKERYPFDLMLHALFGAVTFLAAFGSVNAFALLVSLIILIASAIAEVLQEIRDYKADRTGKFSTAVIRVGIEKSILLIKCLFAAGIVLSLAVTYHYFPHYAVTILAAIPFARFLFFSSSKNYFDNAMKAGKHTEIAFLILFVIVTILQYRPA